MSSDQNLIQQALLLHMFVHHVSFTLESNYCGKLQASQYASLAHPCLCLRIHIEYFTRGHMCAPVLLSSALDIVQYGVYFKL